MPATILIFLLAGGIGLVAAAQRFGAHAAMFERLGGLMLVSGLLGLGFELAHARG